MQAADTVLSRIAGTAPTVITPAFLGSCISLGRHAGTFQIARKDDTAVNFYIGGRIAAALKEAVCKGTLWGLRREARKPGSTFYFKGRARHGQPVVAPQVVTEK
jgi:NADH dehydrogenase